MGDVGLGDWIGHPDLVQFELCKQKTMKIFLRRGENVKDACQFGSFVDGKHA